MSDNYKNFFLKLFQVIALLLFASYMFIPFLWMFATTMRPPVEAFKWPPQILPTEFNFTSYRTVFEKVDFPKFIWNSVFISVGSTILVLFSSSLAAFTFARLKFKGSNVIFIIFLMAMMIPGQVLGIPNFIIMSKLGLVDTHAALILPRLFNAFAIFLIRQFMLTIPISYDEAARIDGANSFYIYSRIVVPMVKPALLTVALQTFIATWNDFYGPLIFLNTESKMTLPIGLTALNGMLGSGNQSSLIAGVLLSLIAPVIFYLIGQNVLMEGINIGGVKA